MTATTNSTGVDERPPRVLGMSFGRLYPLYVDKAEQKGRSKREVDKVIRWLTGYTQRQLTAHVRKETTVEAFFTQAPLPNPDRTLITGVVCGVRVENVEHPTMREVRYLDKLVEELTKGKAMEKILRSPSDAAPAK